MAHDHSHQDNFYLEQLFTIGSCGAIGGIAVLLYLQGTVWDILAPRFHIPLLAAGIALLVLVAIRAIVIWRMAGETGNGTPHQHDHNHEHHPHEHHEHAHCEHDHHDHANCGHDHGHEHEHEHAHEHGHEHSHDHDHSHGWVPARYLVLLLLVLFWYFIPPEGLRANVNFGEVDTSAAFNRTEKGVIPGLTFTALEQAAYTPALREAYEGRTATMVGQFRSLENDDKRFALIRFKMNCCAADAIPLNALVMIDPEWTGARLDMKERDYKWVQVKGRIHFLKRRTATREDYIPALIVFPSKDEPPDDLVKIVQKPHNPWAE